MVALQSRNIYPRCCFCCNFIIAVEQRVVKSCQYEPLFLIHIRVSNLENVLQQVRIHLVNFYSSC